MDFSSGMIFVVIIALWAAYLVPHWLRRREELSAARSVDRCSSAMRVLSRRAAIEPASRGSSGRWPSERTPLARPAPGSYMVMPAREEGTDVVVKRARPVEASVSNAAQPGIPARLSIPAQRNTAVKPGSVTPARRRARLLLSLVALTAVAWLLVALTPLPWVAAMAPMTLLMLDLALLVQLARRRSRALSTAPPVSRNLRDAAPAAAQPTTAVPTTQVRTAIDSAVGHGVVDGVVDLPRLEFDEYVDVRKARATIAEEAPADGWVPVPVPPPTYTLKAKARPAPTRPLASPPAAQSLDAVAGQLGQAPAGGEHAGNAAATEQFGDALDLDAVLARRRAVNQ